MGSGLWLLFTTHRARKRFKTKLSINPVPTPAPTLIPADVAARHGVSMADFDARRAGPGVIAACAELRGLAREQIAEAERRLKNSSPAILPAFIPLAPLRLDLDRLDRNADRPFNDAGEVSLLRRQWAIWRWARTL